MVWRLLEKVEEAERNIRRIMTMAMVKPAKELATVRATGGCGACRRVGEAAEEEMGTTGLRS